MDLTVITWKDAIYKQLTDLAFQLSLARKLYPRALYEVLAPAWISLRDYWSMDKTKYKKAELESIAMAQLEVDLLKIEYANN